jgi:drug/metabolite transporter (DMT)-like permease
MLFALCAMLCFGFSDLVYKRAAARGVPAHHLMMVQSWLYGFLVLIYGLITRTLDFRPGALWGVAAGVFAYTGFYNFAKSLAGGAISINAPIFRLSFTLTALLAVLILHEPLEAFKLAGLACALTGVWLLMGSGAGVSLTPALRRSLVRVLIATACVGIANLIYKVGLLSSATPATLLVAQALVVIVMGTLNTLRIDSQITFGRSAALHASVTAVLLTAAFIFLFEGLARGQASVLVPVAQMGFVVTALVGFLFLREPFSLRKGAGLLFALAALACLAQS